MATYPRAPRIYKIDVAERLLRALKRETREQNRPGLGPKALSRRVGVTPKTTSHYLKAMVQLKCARTEGGLYWWVDSSITLEQIRRQKSLVARSRRSDAQPDE